MNLLRRFVLVGVVATLVDVSLLLALRYSAGWPVPAADAVAVATATAVSWLLHSSLTFPGDPSLRWYRRVGAYVAAAGMALVADVAVLTVLFAWLRPGWWGALLVIKVPALLIAFMVRLANYRRAMFDAVRADQSAPAVRPVPDGEVRLTVVIPAFREEDRIAATVAAVREQLAAVAAHGGLEILVAGDLIRTVAVSPTLDNVLVLGLIVLIRTFLSFSLEIEIEGVPPWRRALVSGATVIRQAAAKSSGSPQD